MTTAPINILDMSAVQAIVPQIATTLRTSDYSWELAAHDNEAVGWLVEVYDTEGRFWTINVRLTDGELRTAFTIAEWQRSASSQ